MTKKALKIRDVAKDHFSSGVSAEPRFSRVAVRVLECRQLLASDLETGKSDPVCFLWCGPLGEIPSIQDLLSAQLQVCESESPGAERETEREREREGSVLSTSVCYTTTDPVWDEEVLFPIDPRDILSLARMQCVVFVRDEDRDEHNNISYDELGQLSIPLAEVILKGKATQESIVLAAAWYKLEKAPGMRRVDGQIKLTIAIKLAAADQQMIESQLHSPEPSLLHTRSLGMGRLLQNTVRNNEREKEEDDNASAAPRRPRSATSPLSRLSLSSQSMFSESSRPMSATRRRAASKEQAAKQRVGAMIGGKRFSTSPSPFRPDDISVLSEERPNADESEEFVVVPSQKPVSAKVADDLFSLAPERMLETPREMEERVVHEPLLEENEIEEESPAMELPPMDEHLPEPEPEVERKVEPVVEYSQPTQTLGDRLAAMAQRKMEQEARQAEANAHANENTEENNILSPPIEEDELKRGSSFQDLAKSSSLLPPSAALIDKSSRSSSQRNLLPNNSAMSLSTQRRDRDRDRVASELEEEMLSAGGNGLSAVRAIHSELQWQRDFLKKNLFNLAQSTAKGFGKVALRLQQLEDEVHSQRALRSEPLLPPAPGDELLPAEQEEEMVRSPSREKNKRSGRKSATAPMKTRSRSNDRVKQERGYGSDDELQGRERERAKPDVKAKSRTTALRDHIKKTRQRHQESIYTSSFGGTDKPPVDVRNSVDPNIQFVFRGDHGQIAHAPMATSASPTTHAADQLMQHPSMGDQVLPPATSVSPTQRVQPTFLDRPQTAASINVPPAVSGYSFRTESPAKNALLNKDFCEVLDNGSLEDVARLLESSAAKPDQLSVSTRNRLFDVVSTLLLRARDVSRPLIWVTNLLTTPDLFYELSAHTQKDLIDGLKVVADFQSNSGVLAMLLLKKIHKMES